MLVDRWCDSCDMQGRLAGGNFYGQEDLTPTALKVKEIEQICTRYSVDIKAAALQFPLAHPRVASIIPGSANAEEAAENKAMLDTVRESDQAEPLFDLCPSSQNMTVLSTRAEDT
jgi:aryl-alcohol dehydrogenase-like predicted oxidoreductase